MNATWQPNHAFAWPDTSRHRASVGREMVKAHSGFAAWSRVVGVGATPVKITPLRVVRVESVSIDAHGRVIRSDGRVGIVWRF